LSKLEVIEIDAAPLSVALLMKCGAFHSHQDGRWRFSPYGGETVYCNDPTEQFPHRAEFGHGLGAVACLDPPMYASIYRDGTRGLSDWDPRREGRMRLLYPAAKPEERAKETWLADIFSAGGLLAV
jgi:hypothetical protein